MKLTAGRAKSQGGVDGIEDVITSLFLRKSKNRYFYHIFVSPGDAPGAITLNVVQMERELDVHVPI